MSITKPNNKFLLIFILVIAIQQISSFIIDQLNFENDHYMLLIQQIILIFLLGIAVKKFGKTKLSQIGIYSWQNWSKKNKWILLIVTPIVIMIFSFTFFSRTEILINHSELFAIGSIILLREFLYGFYQEFLYRGILQTELVKRWGVWIGITVSNLVFTFGPEHFHFYKSNLVGFAFIFCLGLLFSFLYYRFKNLITIGIWHGIGNVFIDGLGILISMAILN
ncbi:MAG TPA: CPBP family intramembrane metalloprotease [Ignavibacteria bacterium]|nr:CPBP family intramembrane metalloprotease [Ignavibacteria bacterium]